MPYTGEKQLLQWHYSNTDVMVFCDLSPEKFQRTPVGDCAKILKIPFVAFF